MKISVITPSRLQMNPNSAAGNLWLDLSLMSVRRQTCWGDHDIELLVGTDDADAPKVPDRFRDGVRTISSGTWHCGQAGAVNGCTKLATGDVIAILEDDDTWEPTKLAYQLPLLDDFDFVSSNQREVDEDRSSWIRTNDFPTPSGWIMRRELWEEMGGFDESFKYHVDTQFLGKLNAAGKKRVHVVERNPDWTRPWLQNVAKRSIISESAESQPLVVRTVNSEGGMARIQRDPAAMAVSVDEHRRMLDAFGEVPW